MRILVTGAGGLLGSKIVELATVRRHEVFATYYSSLPEGARSLRLDLRDRSSVLKAVVDAKPNAVIHCAALTDVDKCELNRNLAVEVNAHGTKTVAEAAKLAGARMAFVSTDYVFDGSKGLYKEEDEPNPVSFYGRSKLMGENAASEELEDLLIARSSVIYRARPASGKINFALWLIENLKNERKVKILADQFVSPTLNTNLAEMLLEACERSLSGIYHLAGSSRVSRYEFATKLAEVFRLDSNLIMKTRMDEMRWIARRPKDSSLDVSKAQRTLKVKPMSLIEALQTLKDEIKVAHRNSS
jgi:dTDP-4-dehydrorhamnose reductase